MAGNINSGRRRLDNVKVLTLKKNNTDLQPPEWLEKEAVDIWQALAVQLQELGLLNKLDLYGFARYCEAEADYLRFSNKIKELNADGNHDGDLQTFQTGAQNLSIWRTLRNDAAKQAKDLSAQFGLTPFARRALKDVITPPKEKPNAQELKLNKYFS